MSKLKKGDDVEVISVSNFTKTELKTFCVNVGDTGHIVGFHKKYQVFAIVANEKFKNSKAGDGVLYIPKSNLKKTNNEYLESNRYKLHKAASETGFSFSKLSRAMGRSDTYISNELKESRFNSRGDLTDKRYNQLINELSIAERTLNGNPAKVVDDSIDIEMESLCIEKPLELEPKEVVPVAPVFIPKQKIKSKTEVNKSIVWFILFILVVIILVLVAGIYKSIF